MIQVLTYDTLEDVVAAYYSCENSEIYSKGPWDWEQDGKRTVWSVRRMLRCRKKEGCWGFCADKGDIHVWVDVHAKPSKIIRMLAHEIGHKQRPFKRTRILEERKAESYADVTLSAFEIMEDIIKNNKEENENNENN